MEPQSIPPITPLVPSNDNLSQTEIENVNQSAWLYFRTHYIPHSIAIIAVAILLIFIFPRAIFHISVFAIVIIGIIYGTVDSKIRRQFLQQFGSSIGYTFSDFADLSTVSGKLFNLGHDRKIYNVLSGKYKDIPNRLFNYTYTVGSGKEQQTFNLTCFEATFNNNMPDIVLISRATFSGLFSEWGLGEHIQLEGDFNKYFSLHVPKGYENEAYEIFSPDVMAKIIDNASKLNFEFNGPKLYIFINEMISTHSKMHEMFNLADLLFEIFRKSSDGVKI